MDRKLILMGIGVLAIIILAWYCMPGKATRKTSSVSGNNQGGGVAHPETFEDLTRLSKYKQPILGSVDGFLTPGECTEVIDIGKMIVKPSTVGFGSEIKIHNARSSQHSWIKHNATKGLLRLTQYISSILKMPPSHFEPFQIVHYGPNQFYKYHLDSCNPEADDYEECQKNLKEFGGRKYTVLIYLNRNYIGGETHFKEIDTLVKGDPGSMVFFNNMKDGSSESEPLSLHAGTPVISGEKWLLNVWVRDRPYKNDYQDSAFPCETMINEINAKRSAKPPQDPPNSPSVQNDGGLPSKEPPQSS
jgi:prolyl 4-hydroxylase